ncbi:MAG: sigma-70 family RNA polymerase sigma factor [Chloroflexota bacterium]|nr:MAG: sigma-70 family RNA polymerase sigma factor [Chloroflexota bacterium]
MTSREELDGLTDEELAERARTDGDAFGVLFDRHHRRVFNYVAYRVGNRADAEDLTARVFFQTLQNLPRFQYRGAPFSAWLFRIAHNVVANWHRDRARHPTAPIEEASEREDDRARPIDAAVDGEDRSELRAAVARLSPDRQLLLVMKFVEDRGTAEIAREMRRTEGAVKALLHRTLVALREELARPRSARHGV